MVFNVAEMNALLSEQFIESVLALSFFGAMNVMADDLFLVTGGPMGTYYAVGGAMKDVLNPVLGRVKAEPGGQRSFQSEP